MEEAINMSNKISEERKALYYIGMILIVIGFILFISNIFTFGNDDMFFQGPSTFMARPLVGMICIIIGSILMNIGKKGTAGSGLILDPEKAREDLKPHSIAKGKMINDAIENIDIVKGMGKSQGSKEIIKIRCKNCGGLNDEDAKFCKFCGREI
jgi:hypothetical protein